MMIRDSTRTESIVKIKISRNAQKNKPQNRVTIADFDFINISPRRLQERKGRAIWSLKTLTRAGRRGCAIWRSDPEKSWFPNPKIRNSPSRHLVQFRRLWSRSIDWNCYNILSGRTYEPCCCIHDSFGRAVSTAIWMRAVNRQPWFPRERHVDAVTHSDLRRKLSRPKLRMKFWNADSRMATQNLPKPDKNCNQRHHTNIKKLRVRSNYAE